MKDSILKGTGNSRFLKSAVPSGTSWADALAMLQAGTFPIDFNGINTEGFQQVGTPLNKANLLKDATAAQIGLPPSATPDGMFQALGNTGELHVWRKTIVTPAGTTTTYPVSTNPNAYQEGDDAKPAGYVLGDVVTGRFMLEGYYNSSHPTYYYADNTPTVSDDGVVSVKDIYGFSGYGSGQDALQTRIRGKYIQCRVDDYTQSDFRNLGVVYIPEDAVVLQYNIASGVYIDRYQPVTGYAAIPAGTTIEYLGKLGDKARVQVVSYVGTGTYGSDHKNSLTFDFVPKMLFVVGPYTSNWPYFMFATEKASYAHYSSQSYLLTFTLWNKTVKWYYDNADGQLNLRGQNYDAVAIG